MVEGLETRALLSFNPMTAGGFSQVAGAYPYLWSAGRDGALHSTYIENERLGYLTATSWNMGVMGPSPLVSDQPIADNARFQIKSYGEANPIGTVVVRNTQVGWSNAESLWATSFNPARWDRIHNDGFYVVNAQSGTNSLITFEDVDITAVDTRQSIIFDGGSARRLYFRNVSWDNKVTIKVTAGSTIQQIVFENSRGDVDIMLQGGTLGGVYNDNAGETVIRFSGGTKSVVNGLPADLAQPTAYGGAGPLLTRNGATVIEAENFDTHGEGASFHDVSAEPNSVYRPNGTNGPAGGSGARVDVAAGGSNGYHVSSVRASEWIDYTIRVEQGGMYRVDALLKSLGNGGKLRIGIGGRYVTYGGVDAAHHALPNTGGAFATMSSDALYLPAGEHVMHVQFEHSMGPAADVGQFDAFTLVPVAAPTAAPAAVTTLRPGLTNGTRSTLNLDWDGVAGADGYVVQRSVDGVTWTTVGEVSAHARDAAGPVTDFTDAKLAADTAYAYRVAAYNIAGASAWSSPVSLRTAITPLAPLAPVDVVFRQVSSTQYQATWTDASNNERSFKVEQWDGSWWDQVAGAGANGTAATVASLNATTSYRFRLAATNTEGVGYAPTFILPANAGFESGSLSAGWKVTAGSAAVLAGGSGGTKFASLGAGASVEQTLTNLTPNTTYTLHGFTRAGAGGSVTIGVRDASGDVTQTELTNTSWADGSLSFTTGPNATMAVFVLAGGAAGGVDDIRISEAQPATPVITSVTTGSASAAITWTLASTENLAGFEVWRSNDGKNWDLASPLLAPNTRAFTDSWWVLGTASTFLYQVRASQRGDQPTHGGAYINQPNFSVPVKAIVTHATPRPTSPAVVGTGVRRVDLAWEHPARANTFDGFLVQRSRDGGPFETIARVSSFTTSFADVGLPTTLTGGVYTYRLVSFAGDAVQSAASVAVSAGSILTEPETPPEEQPPDENPPEEPEGPVIPHVPTGLSASATTGTTVHLSWSDRSTDETGFAIERSTDGGLTFVEIGTVAADVTSFDDDVAEQHVPYQYRIRALGAGESSEFTDAVSVTLPDVDAPAPVALEVTNVTSSSISLSWTASNDAGGGVVVYRVYRNGNLIATTDATTHDDAGLAASRGYTYTVTAVDGAGNVSAAGAPILATTARRKGPRLSTAAASSTTATLSWTDEETGEKGYRVWASRDGGKKWTWLGSVRGRAGKGTRMAVKVRALPSGTWMFKIASFTPKGQSDYSNVETLKVSGVSRPWWG